MSTNKVNGYAITAAIRMGKQTAAEIETTDGLGLMPHRQDVAGRTTGSYIPCEVGLHITEAHDLDAVLAPVSPPASSLD